MRHFTCPKCQQDSIAFKDKYLTCLWLNIHCPNCGARLCAQPLLLAVSTMIYFWAVMWFLAWAVLDRNWALILYLVPVWLTLDLLNIYYMPLAILRPKGK